jgi:membrane peptidoglycan carboxypeptidase
VQQLLQWTLKKSSAVGRLLFMSALGGVLAAAMVLPVVAATGILVRNTSDKFTTLTLSTSSALPQRSEIFDRQGHLITYVYAVDLGPGRKFTGINRQPVPYGQISPYMLQAIVAIEDNRYWQHGAIDVKGTLRALVNDLRHQPVQGGSTIAQQYVKGVLILSAPNVAAQQAAIAENMSRKLNELRMAVDIEHTMSKQSILDGYLNDAYFDEGAWGIEAAAETYFGTTAANLNLLQAATLAGIVENPTKYDPINHPADALARRNIVLTRMMQVKVLGPAVEAHVAAEGLGLRPAGVQSGCLSPTVGIDGFFCDYLIHTFLLSPEFGTTVMDRAKLLSTGGLKIYTSLSPQDQAAANYAVRYVLPENSNYWNPGHNADTTVLMQPGTGRVLAIAQNVPYGTGKGQTEVDYAVNSQYGGGSGVQTGSSSKVFTLLTALQQGIPFGFQQTVQNSETVTGYYSCTGAPAGRSDSTGQYGAWDVVNASQGDAGTYTLYTGTTDSINTFFAELEAKVGLCSVVRTAMNLGVTWADGTPLTSEDKTPLGTAVSADDTPSFTLGSINVSPMSMAAAYATVASGGIYCKPTPITKVINAAGQSLKVPSAGCRRALSSDVAAAANYILQGVFTWPGATGAGLGPLPSGYQIAGKTGTSNVANGFGTPYAAFAGYTSNLISYTSVFNPISPTVHDTMGGQNSCYRAFGGYLDCPGEMFGANAPGSTWRVTFDGANLAGSHDFAQLSLDSAFWSQGNGQFVKPPKKKKGPPKGGGGNGGGGGNNGGGGGTGGGPTGGPPHP